MAFNSQQIYPIDLNPSKAVGVDIPFNGPAVFKSNYLTKDAIKNNLINFFLTNPGERYLSPSFGGGLRAFIFEQISTANTESLLEDVGEKIAIYFPSIKVESLNVIGIEDQNTIKIELSYSIINTNITDNLEIEFT
jgi:phage baseplate assembly protein W